MTESVIPPSNAHLAPSRKCVLIVEDEVLIRTFVSEELRDEGYYVIEAVNADEAVAILKSSVPIDLVISDVRMPGSLDGIGLLALVRKSFPALPVIITSGHLEPQKAIAQGASQFLSKPFSMEWVVKAVQDALARIA